MDLSFSSEVEVPAEVLFAEVVDLEGYPAWLSIVTRVEPLPGSGNPAWSVELRGQVGPLSRSKRLRMERTVLDPPRRVCFERREVDGRHHSAWRLEATVEPVGSGLGGAECSRVVMSLHYGGQFAGVVFERVLRDEVERSRPRLAEAALVRARGRD